MEWDAVPKAAWTEERRRAKELELPDCRFRGLGGDIDPACVQLAELNARAAGVGDRISAQVADLKAFRPQGDSGLVLCNPPYGERLLDVKAAEQIIREMGRVFARKPGFSYAIISPHEEFETLFGRPADKRRKLYNGMLKCQLYMYFK